MHRIFSLLVALFALISPAVAQVSAIDDSINSVMEPITNAIMKVIFFTSQCTHKVILTRSSRDAAFIYECGHIHI